MPRWRPEYLRPLFDAVSLAAAYVVRFRGITAQPTSSVGTDEQLDIFRELTHERLATDPHRHQLRVLGWAFEETGKPVDVRLDSMGAHTAVEHLPRPDAQRFL